MRPALVVTALSAFVSTNAIAQPIHQRRSAPLELELPERSAIAKTLAPTRPARRPISSERYLDALARSADFRDSTIRRLAALLEKTPPAHPDRPEILFRLAEAHAAKQRFHRARRFQLVERAARTRRASAKTSLLARRAEHAETERRAMRAAIAAYAELTGDRAHAGYPRMDRALFFYAHTLRRAGRTELALAVFKKLSRRYPQSPLVAHAYLAFAEHHFGRGELDAADRFYRAVLELPETSIHTYALYKRGWVQLNRGRPRAALGIFFDVVGRAAKTSPLRRQASRDFVRAYARVGKPHLALAAFRRVDRARALDLLEVLALHYIDMGKHPAAIATLRELLRRRPGHDHACEWQLQIQQATAATGTRAQIAAETLALIRRSRRHPGCRADARIAAAELAKQWHYEADKTHAGAIADHAAAIYRAYLSAFAGPFDAPRMRFHLGDLLWLRAERSPRPARARRWWRASAAAFDQLVTRGRAEPALIREAAYAAVLGWLNALQLDPTARPPDPGDARPRPRPIRGDHAALLASLERYLDAVPRRAGDAQRIDIEFLGARTLWQHDHLDRALPRLERLVAEHPRHRTAELAANMILDALIRLDQIDRLARAAAAMAANKPLLAGRAELRERLAEVDYLSARKLAERLERDRRWLECGEAYLAIAREHRGARSLDEVLYNAALCYEKARSIGYALALLRQLRRDFPDSELAARALVKLGRGNSRIARYAHAARYYEEYARRYAGEDDAARALADAVTYRRALGDDRAAIADIEYFLRTYGSRRPVEATEALFGLAAIHDKRGDHRALAATLERTIRAARSAGEVDRLVIAHAWLGEIAWERSCRRRRPDGLCARPSRVRGSAAAVCGGIERPLVSAVPRDRRQVARARRHFSRALALAGANAAEITGLDRARRAAASYWTAAARFYLAEAELERFLEIELPALDFDPRRPRRLDASRRAFAAWMRSAIARGERADARYREILEGDSAPWAIAAAARMGQIPAAIADGVYRVGIPASIAGDLDAVDRYCAELEREAAPLEERAVAALSFCLRESTDRGADTRWSALCERELERLRPRRHPADREETGEPLRVAPVLDDGGVIERLGANRTEP